MNNEQLLQFIRNANNFAEVRNSGILPNPDGDDGYYFVSYSHVDYKPVLTDVISLQTQMSKYGTTAGWNRVKAG